MESKKKKKKKKKKKTKLLDYDINVLKENNELTTLCAWHFHQL